MVINQGFKLDTPQTLFYLGNISLLDEMVARVRIAPRGWLDPCGIPRCGDVSRVIKECGCNGNVVSQRFPVEIDATIIHDEMLVLMQSPDTSNWASGLYEAQVVILYRGSEMPINDLVLMELGDIH